MSYPEPMHSDELIGAALFTVTSQLLTLSDELIGEHAQLLKLNRRASWSPG